jgi:hypothetical protein
MPNPVPAGCYLAKLGSVPWPQTALPLWDDDVDSPQVIPHLMDKAADRNVSPEIVAAFSDIPGASARIEKPHAGDHWVIRRSRQ